MNHLRLLCLSAVPPFVLVAETVCFEIVQVALGNCDAKLGCSGGVSFALLLSLVGGVVAAFALLAVASLRRQAWAGVSQLHLLVWSAALEIVLALALRSIGRWPFEPLASVAWWAVLAGALGYVLSLVVPHSVVRA